MGSEAANPVEVTTSKKSPKAPRKIHKAAREKLKRDHMNDLFVDLGKALDVDHTNNGKACILRETIRLLGELLSQVDSLKKENTTLLSESSYVTVERNELLEENSVLDAEVKRLQREIDEKVNCSNFDVSQPQSNSTTQLPKDHASLSLIAPTSDQAPIVGPLFVMPLHHEPQGLADPKVPSRVSRPRPRYPSSSDSWPSHILSRQTSMVEDV